MQPQFFVIGGVVLFIASIARPDVAKHAHFNTTRFVRPGYPHLRFARRQLAYLVKTKSLGLTYQRSASFSSVGAFHPGDGNVDGRLHGIGDSDFGIPRCVSGALVMVAGAAVVWRVLAQGTPAISPGEAEFYALTTTVSETVTVRQFFEELGFVFPSGTPSATQVFCDSRTASTLAEHGATSSRTRFIHRRLNFCRFYHDDGVIYVASIRGNKNPANGLTKFTFGDMFRRERAYMLGLPA